MKDAETDRMADARDPSLTGADAAEASLASHRADGAGSDAELDRAIVEAFVQGGASRDDDGLPPAGPGRARHPGQRCGRWGAAGRATGQDGTRSRKRVRQVASWFVRSRNVELL